MLKQCHLSIIDPEDLIFRIIWKRPSEANGEAFSRLQSAVESYIRGKGHPVYEGDDSECSYIARDEILRSVDDCSLRARLFLRACTGSSSVPPSDESWFITVSGKVHLY